MTRFYPSIDIKYGRKSIEKALDRGQITPEDAKAISDYIEQYQAVGTSRSTGS